MELKQDINTKIDTANEDFHGEAIQQKKELLEQMKKDAEQMQNKNDQFHQQVKQDDMLRDINASGVDDKYSNNEFGKIIKPNKLR
jgi:lipid A disaccharide synthetase